MDDFRSANYVTKTHYLRFRKEWKKNYMRLSHQIRALKNSEAEFRWWETYIPPTNPIDENYKNYNCAAQASASQSLKAILGNQAAYQMALLDHMKLCARFSVMVEKLQRQTNQ